MHSSCSLLIQSHPHARGCESLFIDQLTRIVFKGCKSLHHWSPHTDSLTSVLFSCPRWSLFLLALDSDFKLVMHYKRVGLEPMPPKNVFTDFC